MKKKYDNYPTYQQIYEEGYRDGRKDLTDVHKKRDGYMMLKQMREYASHYRNENQRLREIINTGVKIKYEFDWTNEDQENWNKWNDTIRYKESILRNKIIAKIKKKLSFISTICLSASKLHL